MKIIKKLLELKDVQLSHCKAHERLVMDAFMMQTLYPQDENACVILLDSEPELEAVFKLFPYLRNKPAEINEILEGPDGDMYAHLLYITCDDGAGISIFWRIAR